MSLVTVAEVRSVLSTALNDAQLQMVIEREEAAIVKRLGAAYVDASTAITETVPGEGTKAFLRRGITSVSSVSETLVKGQTPYTLTASDYYIWAGEGMLERLPVGSKWGELVTVQYVPQDDRMLWRAAILELVRVAVERKGLKSESVAGEYSYTASDNSESDRAQVLRRVGFWNI